MIGIILILCALPLIIILLIAIYIYYYYAFKRPAYRSSHFTGRVNGTVLGLSNFSSNNIRVPLVEYTVNGIKYKVAGPRFSSYVEKYNLINTHSLADSQSNIPLDGELPLVVHYKNGTYAAQKAMDDRYPVGKEVPVFFDPANPKKAFVERDAPMSKELATVLISIFSFFVLLGVILLIIGLFLL